VYFGARFYDPNTGRWLSRDGLGEAGGINLYSYCGGNPISRHDPLGLVVYNDSLRTIWIKPETGPKATQAIPISPGGTWPGAQDGIADPGAHPGQVYKNVTGVDLRVNEDGSIDWSTDPSGSIDWAKQFGGQIAIGGWKDKDWLEELHKRKPNADYGWDKLFNPPNQSSDKSSNKCNK
jgi:uncharacterized protein RhaS with RHS repeats